MPVSKKPRGKSKTQLSKSNTSKTPTEGNKTMKKATYLILTLLLVVMFCACTGKTFSSLKEADCHIEKARTSTTDKPTILMFTPSIRKNETAANAGLRMTGLIEDGKPSKVNPATMHGPETMYGAKGAKGPFWSVRGYIDFKRDVAMLRVAPGGPAASLMVILEDHSLILGKIITERRNLLP